MDTLRIAYAPGVMPGKWLDRWNRRRPDAPVRAWRHDSGDPRALLASGEADMVFVRYPDGDTVADGATHAIPLYEELPVVCAPKDDDVELYDESVPASELEGRVFLDLADYPPEVGGAKMALEVVASGAGLLVLPMSVARLFQRRDVVARVLEGAPPTRVALAWPRPADGAPNDDLVEEFIGIVRGRRETSSRQPSVRERQQEEASRAQRRRQGAGGAAGKGSGQGGGAAKGSASKGGGAAKSSKGGSAKGRGSGGARRPGKQGRR